MLTRWPAYRKIGIAVSAQALMLHAYNSGGWWRPYEAGGQVPRRTNAIRRTSDSEYRTSASFSSCSLVEISEATLTSVPPWPQQDCSNVAADTTSNSSKYSQPVKIGRNVATPS